MARTRWTSRRVSFQPRQPAAPAYIGCAAGTIFAVTAAWYSAYLTALARRYWPYRAGLNASMTPITAAAIITEARSWVGTPFRHQSRIKGLGVDCVGLLVGIGEALGVEVHDQTGYGRQPYGGQLQATLAGMVRVTEAQPGDVLLITFDLDPQHTAVLTDRDTIIHAYERVGKCVEHRFASAWRARVRNIYRNRELAKQQEAAHV